VAILKIREYLLGKHLRFLFAVLISLASAGTITNAFAVFEVLGVSQSPTGSTVISLAGENNSCYRLDATSFVSAPGSIVITTIGHQSNCFPTPQPSGTYRIDVDVGVLPAGNYTARWLWGSPPLPPLDMSTSFVAGAGGPAGLITPVAGVWWNPNEAGSGYGLDFKDGVLIVQIFSYLDSGPAQWYLAAGPVSGNVFSATLDKYLEGQCISCAYKAPRLAGNDGNIIIAFTSPTTANVFLFGGRQVQIQRYFQP
jgi:hypothetical protein